MHFIVTLLPTLWLKLLELRSHYFHFQVTETFLSAIYILDREHLYLVALSFRPTGKLPALLAQEISIKRNRDCRQVPFPAANTTIFPWQSLNTRLEHHKWPFMSLNHIRSLTLSSQQNRCNIAQFKVTNKMQAKVLLPWQLYFCIRLLQNKYTEK